MMFVIVVPAIDDMAMVRSDLRLVNTCILVREKEKSTQAHGSASATSQFYSLTDIGTHYHVNGCLGIHPTTYERNDDARRGRRRLDESGDEHGHEKSSDGVEVSTQETSGRTSTQNLRGRSHELQPKQEEVKEEAQDEDADEDDAPLPGSVAAARRADFAPRCLLGLLQLRGSRLEIDFVLHEPLGGLFAHEAAEFGRLAASDGQGDGVGLDVTAHHRRHVLAPARGVVRRFGGHAPGSLLLLMLLHGVDLPPEPGRGVHVDVDDADSAAAPARRSNVASPLGQHPGGRSSAEHGRRGHGR